MNPIRWLLLSCLLLVTACAGQGDPAATVEQYLQAKTEGDRDTLASLLCSEMEAALDREASTFDTVSGVEIENMECAFDGSNQVSCEGTIVATYGAQDTEFPLTQYRVVQEDGEWKWCGEA